MSPRLSTYNFKAANRHLIATETKIIGKGKLRYNYYKTRFIYY